jgi:hypothetical protein
MIWFRSPNFHTGVRLKQKWTLTAGMSAVEDKPEKEDHAASTAVFTLAVLVLSRRLSRSAWPPAWSRTLGSTARS